MEWYEILLLVLSYLIIGAVLVGIYLRITNETLDSAPNEAMSGIFLWPIVILAFIINCILVFIIRFFTE